MILVPGVVASGMFAVSTLLDAGEVGLLKSPPGYDPGTGLLSLTFADFTGYAPVSPQAWFLDLRQGQYQALTTGIPLAFTVGGSPSRGKLVYGWYCKQAGGGYLVAGTFAAAVAMDVAGRVLSLSPGIGLPINGGLVRDVSIVSVV